MPIAAPARTVAATSPDLPIPDATGKFLVKVIRAAGMFGHLTCRFGAKQDFLRPHPVPVRKALQSQDSVRGQFSQSVSNRRGDKTV